MATESITLDATTVEEIGATQVGCGNLWERDFELPDGSSVSAMSARLAFGPLALDVYVGSRFRLDNENYRVTAIDKDAGRRGQVTLQRS